MRLTVLALTRLSGIASNVSRIGLVQRKVKKTSPLYQKRDNTTTLSDGVLLNLTLVGDGIISSVYTASLVVGAAQQNYPLQLDTGSSDSWIVTPSCPSDVCASYNGPKYDPLDSAGAQDTGDSFDLQYLQGYVSGPIWWDVFDLGPYSILNQAFGAADTVQNEDMSEGYSGVLALALPLNSKIASEIPPSSGNAPDGAPVISNLFGLGAYGPREHFFSILLERPGMERVPSLLGIGQHPAWILPSLTSIDDWSSALQYNEVSEYQVGTRFWALPVTGLTAYVNGSAIGIPVGESIANPNVVDPIGVLDTGIPFIFGRTDIINALYGAYGIGPGADGSYYVPCASPINMSISLGSQAFPIHPLDVTYVSKSVQNPSLCIGAVQARADLADADFVLGAAFMRNVYTVLSYNDRTMRAYANLTIPQNMPAVALLSITNITEALADFNTVRVQHQPLSSNSTSPTPGTSTSPGNGGGKHGLGRLWALVGVLLGVALVIIVLVARWFIRRHRAIRRITAVTGSSSVDKSGGDESPGSIALATLAVSRDAPTDGIPIDLAMDQDTLRSKLAERYKYSRHSGASFLTSSTSTRPGEFAEPNDFGEMHSSSPDENGYDRHPRNDTTLVSARSRAARSRSRGRSLVGTVDDGLSLDTTLSAIPMLDEITPEALSTGRYASFARQAQAQYPTIPHKASLTRMPIPEDPLRSPSEPTPHALRTSTLPSADADEAQQTDAAQMHPPHSLALDGSEGPAEPHLPVPPDLT